MEEMYKRLLEFTNDGVYRYTFENGEILAANEGFCKIIDAHSTPREIIGKKLAELIRYTQKEGRIRKELAEKGEIRGFEYHFQTLSGEDRWVIHDSLVIKDEKTGEKIVEATVKDITARKIAENRLYAEKERLSVTLKSIGDAVISTDIEGRVSFMNQAAEQLTGWSSEEAEGRRLSEVFVIINEKTRKKCVNPVEKVLETGEVVGLANHTALIARDGTERIIADSGSPIKDKNGKTFGVILVFRDITAQYQMEEERRKSERLESTSLLAGGIAHDFNNLLMAILGNISLASLRSNENPEVLNRLHEAERAVMRAKDLTNQLLTFAKGGTPVKQTASIRNAVIESSEFAVRGSAAKCEYKVDCELWPVDADVGQISEVVNNIVINACQAMPTGGVIKIGGENVEIERNAKQPPPPGRYVKLTVADEGIGIQPEHLNKIFDPYFTTKQKGSGLGLAVCHSIIKRHDGYITVDSTLGQGTTFTIYLPAASSGLKSEGAAAPCSERRGARILLMDDDESLRIVAKELLGEMGFKAEIAADGTKAVELYAHAILKGEKFDAAILDLTVQGGLGGLETAKRILTIDPAARCIVCSGYSNDEIMTECRKFGFKAALKKPYTTREIGEAINAAFKEV